MRVKQMLYYCKEQYLNHEHLDKNEFEKFANSFFWPSIMFAMKEGTANDLIINTKAEEMQTLLHKYEDIIRENNHARIC